MTHLSGLIFGVGSFLLNMSPLPNPKLSRAPPPWFMEDFSSAVMSSTIIVVYDILQSLSMSISAASTTISVPNTPLLSTESAKLFNFSHTSASSTSGLLSCFVVYQSHLAVCPAHTVIRVCSFLLAVEQLGSSMLGFLWVLSSSWLFSRVHDYLWCLTSHGHCRLSCWAIPAVYRLPPLLWTVNIIIVAYFMADRASCKDSCRSMTSYDCVFWPNRIDWWSKKQLMVSRSSMEAEYYALGYIVIWKQLY